MLAPYMNRLGTVHAISDAAQWCSVVIDACDRTVFTPTHPACSPYFLGYVLFCVADFCFHLSSFVRTSTAPRDLGFAFPTFGVVVLHCNHHGESFGILASYYTGGPTYRASHGGVPRVGGETPLPACPDWTSSPPPPYHKPPTAISTRDCEDTDSVDSFLDFWASALQSPTEFSSHRGEAGVGGGGVLVFNTYRV